MNQVVQVDGMVQVGGRLQARDAAYMYLEDGHDSATVLTYWVLSTESGVAPTITVTEVAERFRRCAAHDEIFVSRLVPVPGHVGYPSWRRDPNFLIDSRITEHTPGRDWAGVQDLFSDIASTPMDLTLGVWRTHIVPDVGGVPGQSGRVTLLAYNWHHSAFDGQRMIGILRGIVADHDPSSPPPLPPPRRIPAQGPSRGRAFVSDLIRIPVALASFGAALVPGRSAEPTQTAPYLPPTAPRTRFNAPLRGRRRPELALVELASIKAIRATLPGATVNDVLMSIVARALRLYLTEVGEPPTGSLTALMPVARPAGSGSGSGSVNGFTAVPVDLHTEEPDLATQLRAIHHSCAAAKASVTPEPVVLQKIPALVLRIVGAVSRVVAARSGPSDRVAATAVVTNTNVPTPLTTFAGARIDVATALIVLSAPTMLAHSVDTVRGTVAFGITVDSAVMPDTAQYAACITRSAAQHLEELGLSD